MIATTEYAAELVRLVRADWDAGQLEAIGSWTALHSVCDANEYLIEADEKFGIDFQATDEQIRFANRATEIAEQTLFPKKEDS
jgi:hypothetical protein